MDDSVDIQKKGRNLGAGCTPSEVNDNDRPVLEFLLEAGALAGSFAQVEQARAANFAVSFHFHFFNAR
jgi:hypothetical protein